MAELIYKDGVYYIVGAAMEVHSILGPGFLEAVYQEASAIELHFKKHSILRTAAVDLEYKSHTLERKYLPDYLCFEEIVIEIKALKEMWAK